MGKLIALILMACFLLAITEALRERRIQKVEFDYLETPRKPVVP